MLQLSSGHEGLEELGGAGEADRRCPGKARGHKGLLSPGLSRRSTRARAHARVAARRRFRCPSF